MDYEREDAQDWKINAVPLPRRQAREVPYFVTDPDTAARSAWRHNEKPQVTVRIPKDVTPAEQQLIKSAGNQKSLFTYFPQLYRIQENTQTHFSVVRQQRANGLDIEIWGNADQAKLARDQINTWIRESRPKKVNHLWAHIPSHTPEEREVIEEELDKEALRQQYRRDPPTESPHAVLATFKWPTDCDKPEVYLGRNFEALDPIRMDDSCWITYERVKSVFYFKGDTSDGTKSALQRVRAIVYQIAARNIDTIELSLVKTGPILDSTMVFIPYPDHTQVGERIKYLVRPHISIESEYCSPRSEDMADVIGKDDSGQLRKLTARILSGLQYYHGNLTMTARYGTFITRMHNSVKTMREWKDMLKQPECESEVTTELGNVELEEKLFGRFSAADGVLRGLGAQVDNLRHVAPIFAVSFFLKSSDPATGTLRLDLEFQADINDHFDCTSYKWSRADHQTGEVITILAANLIDLESARAWQIGITAGHVVEELRFPALADFRKNVEIVHKIATDPLRSPSESFVTWKFIPNIQVLSVTEKKAFRYSLYHGQYHCEIAQCKKLSVPKTESVVKESRWSVTVSCSDWARNFVENANMEIGKGVQWKATSNSFFPGGKDGFTEFLATLTTIQDLIVGKPHKPRVATKNKIKGKARALIRTETPQDTIAASTAELADIFPYWTKRNFDFVLRQTGADKAVAAAIISDGSSFEQGSYLQVIKRLAQLFPILPEATLRSELNRQEESLHDTITVLSNYQSS